MLGGLVYNSILAYECDDIHMINTNGVRKIGLTQYHARLVGHNILNKNT